MSTAMPQIPPRPVRAQDHALAPGMPKVPPRPVNRRIQRSPSRERFASSPLNEAPFPSHLGTNGQHSLLSAESHHIDPPRRPPSVTLPSLGQEGNEYGEVLAALGSPEGSPKETRSVANDLHIHAPKPSLPTSSAKQRVSAVTRTDSGQAAAFGIGRAASEKSDTEDNKEPPSRSIKPKSSFTSLHSDRPPSSLDGDHGIPEIGQRVPMLPLAGDVQAPSPVPGNTPYAPGIGFHNDGSKPRHHGRRTSARGFEGPPGSYGLHGHGVIPHDRFEKAYYEKHPDLLKKEIHHYGEERAEWALSSEDLNRVVRDTASRGTGVGTSPAVRGTPTEEIGFQAAEEYASRMSSPHPTSSHLARVTSASDEQGKNEFENSLKKGLSRTSTRSGSEEEGVIHVEEPGRRGSRLYEVEYQSTDDLGVTTTPGLDEQEIDYNAPILAPDEVAKEPFGYDLNPAVSPFQERRGSAVEDSIHHHLRTGSASSVNGSRPTSRPTSIHSGFRVEHESTPLEDLEEYEPLFPEDEKSGQAQNKPLTAADKVKRPELRTHKFPSQDVWEDTPASLQYTATVSTPQLPEEDDARTVIEGDSHEEEKQNESAEKESHEEESFFQPEKKPWAADVQEISRIPRFPSRDVWEDTPESLNLQTTVNAPQVETEQSPLDAAAAPSKPHIPPRPTRAKPETSPEVHPVVPERPQRSREAPGAETSASAPLSSKPKPQIPARPARLVKRESAEEVPASSTTAAETKAKPPVPSRPVGSKIAALQNGFMLDLNKRLQLGPKAPKKEEPSPEEKVEEQEKIPLADARKGRARGPVRKAPTKTAAAPSTTDDKPASTLSFSVLSTLWEIEPEGTLSVSSQDKPSPSGAVPSEPEPEPTVAEPEAPPLAANLAGEKLGDAPADDDASGVPPPAEALPVVEKDQVAAPHPAHDDVDPEEEVAPHAPEDTTMPSKADVEEVQDNAFEPLN